MLFFLIRSAILLPVAVVIALARAWLLGRSEFWPAIGHYLISAVIFGFVGHLLGWFVFVCSVFVLAAYRVLFNSSFDASQEIAGMPLGKFLLIACLLVPCVVSQLIGCYFAAIGRIYWWTDNKKPLPGEESGDAV